jgi:hypothetical protein
MALKIRNNANPDLIGDIQPGWSIDENATPHLIGDGSASVGGVQFSAGRRDDSEFLLNKTVTVYYEPEGTVAAGNNVTGVFDSVDTSGPSASATSTNFLSTFTAEKNIRPFFPLTNKLRTITGTNVAGSSTDIGFFPRLDPTKQLVGTLVRDYTFDTGPRAAIKYYDYTGVVTSKTVLTGGNFVSTTFPYEIDNLGRIYISDQQAKTISVYSTTGSFITSWSSPSTDSFGFTTIKYNPFDNNIWVIDNISRVRVFNKSGGLVRTWTTYDDLFRPSGGVGVRGSDIAFTASGAHVAQPDGVYAYSSTGTPLYSTKYQDVDYDTGGGRKSLEIDQFGNYVLAIIGGIYVYGQRAGVVSKALLLSGQPATGNPSGWGLCVTPDGHYMIGVEPVGTVYSFQIFAGAPSTIRGYFFASINEVADTSSKVSYSGSNSPAVYPGWTDSVWTKLNELCAATGKEIVLQNDSLLIRDIATGSIQVDNFLASPAASGAATDAVKAITVINQNASILANDVVYDYRTEQSAPISVAVGQTTFVRIETPVSLVNVQQPVMSPGTVGLYPSDGQFFVFDRDGINIGSASYQRAGMSLSAQIDPDDSTAIILQIVGPRVNIDATQGPYTIGSIVGDGKATGISIIGSGVKINPEPITVYTGADPSIVSTEFGQTIDNVFVANSNAAYSRGAWAAASLNGVSQTLNITIPTDSIGGLGLAPGSTFIYRKCRWRVVTSKFQNATVALTAQPYTTVGEHDAKYSGQTIGAHDAVLAGLTLGDSALKPLY